MKFKEYDAVVLTKDIDQDIIIKNGHVGTVLMINDDKETYLVEFRGVDDLFVVEENYLINFDK